MKAYPYTPKTGDVAWVNYIPVRFVSDNFQEGTYNQKGYVAIDMLQTSTGKQAWVDYVPVVIDDTRTDAWLINSVGYVPVNYSGTGDGTAANKGLSLNFVGSSTLDPRITFSRASNATVTNSSGYIVYAPHNLLTYSEQFDNSTWVKTTTTVAANSFVAPSGNTTADTLTASGANSTTLQTFTAIASPYTFSVSLYRKTGTGNIDITVDGTTWVTKTITAGWTRVETTLTPTAGSKTAGIRIATNGDAIYAWGAQLELRSSASTYNPTTVKNLLGYSEAFDNAGWNKIRSSVVGNSTYAPNGTLTADSFIEDTNALGHYLDQTYAGFTAGTPYTFSIYAKNLTRRYLQLILPSAAFGANIVAVFDLDLGVCTQSGGTSVAITSVGNGWYRCSVTATATITISTTVQIRLASTYSTTPSSYTGNGTSGIYIWGVQLADSGSLDAYVNNPVATPSAATYYGARFDHDPVTLQPKGLLIEEQRTNLLLNSKIDGTSLATQSVTVSATAYSLSFYGTGSVVLSGTASATVSGTGVYPTRTTYTFTPTAGTLTLTVTGTVQYAQLEAGAFATSYIPTVASQVTRSADVALIQGSNFSGWYNATEGTLFSNAGFASAPFTGSNRFVGSVAINDATGNNYIGIGYTVVPGSSLRVVGGEVYVSGSAQTSFTTGNVSENSNYKTAIAYKLNNTNFAYYGNINTTDTSVTIPTVTQMQIGVGRGGAYLNGYIKSLAYYPRRLTNAELQAVTA